MALTCAEKDTSHKWFIEKRLASDVEIAQTHCGRGGTIGLGIYLLSASGPSAYGYADPFWVTHSRHAKRALPWIARWLAVSNRYASLAYPRRWQTRLVRRHDALVFSASMRKPRSWFPRCCCAILPHLADEIHKLEAASAHSLHLDVMDGHFVPNITYGLPIVEAVRSVTSLPIEAHLMISEPERYAEQFFAAGADAITFHVEAVATPEPLLKKLRTMGAVAGVALNPETPLSAVTPYLSECDLVLVMSVSPGFGGQSFNPVALEKLSTLRAQVGEHVVLEVDGGVNATTIANVPRPGPICTWWDRPFSAIRITPRVSRH